ncbi:MAG: acetylglutamate kinase [Candidatus Promineifilaceae bacterium]
MRVLKVGGNELSDSNFLAGLAHAIATLSKLEPVVIVHGGGRAIADLHTQLGIATIKVDGLRVTSGRSLGIAEMVLSGQANKLLVRALLAVGVDALGISGVDAQLLTAKKKAHPTTDLGYVGEVAAVRTNVLERLLSQGFVPVVSPISADSNQQPYNINADEAATAIASALQADLFDFISNVPGVLNEGNPIPSLTVTEANALIESGVVYGGMIPKVNAALSAVAKGVKRTRIVNLAGLLTDSGTVFSQ